jgi:hypothetical protein
MTPPLSSSSVALCINIDINNYTVMVDRLGGPTKQREKEKEDPGSSTRSGFSPDFLLFYKGTCILLKGSFSKYLE